MSKLNLAAITLIAITIMCVSSGTIVNCDQSVLERVDFTKCSQFIQELVRNLQESRAQFEQQITDRQLIMDRGTLDADYNSAFYDVEIAKDNIAIIDGQLESLWLKCDCVNSEDIDLVKFMDIPVFSEGTLVEDMRDRRVLDLRLNRLDQIDNKQAEEVELLNRERAKIQSKIDAGLEKRIQWRHGVAAGMMLQEEEQM